MSQGKLIIFSAPSGSGKTTLVHHLLPKSELKLAFSVSATSREKRPNEEHGKDYYFLSADEFRKRISADEFLEWEEVYTDQFYGTLRSEINRIHSEGQTVVFDVDVLGGINLKKKFGDQALSIFIMPPSVQVLAQRLRSRNTDSEDRIKQRLAKAKQEIEMSEAFDIIIENDILELAIQKATKAVNEFLAL